MRKKTSVNFENEQKLLATCDTAYTLSMISGRWKPAILWQLLRSPQRYRELKQLLPGITERMLTLSMKELERDKLVSKKRIKGFPPQVEYELTGLGRSLESTLTGMSDWGSNNRR